MQLTEAMRRHAKAKGWVAADATDEQIKAVLGQKLFEGAISQAEWADLQANKAPDPRAVVTQIVGESLAEFEKRLEARFLKLTEAISKTSSGDDAAKKKADEDAAAAKKKAEDDEAAKKKAAEIDAAVATALKRHGIPVQADGADPDRVSPTALLSRAAESGWLEDPGVRVKKASERYSKSRSNLVWPSNSKHIALRGRQVTFPGEEGPGLGRPLETPSQADKAFIGAWYRWALHSGGYRDVPPGLRMREHDLELVKEAIHELPWTGTVGGEDGTPVDNVRLAEVYHKGANGVKALLDDSTSGGIYAAPQVVEDAILQPPLLYGELYPYVTVTNLARGRRITGPTMGTPTFTSGIPEGTAIPLFDTTNFIGSLDTTIFTAVGAMEIGLDFEEDSPANIGQMVVARYGEAALQYLDAKIALGDGVSEMKGIFNTTGATAVGATNGAAGPLVVADAEGLFFGVNKAFRTSRGGRNVLIGNEVNYRRFRAIPTAADYNTRVYGENYSDYTVMGTRYCVVPDVPNNKLAYINLGYYRLYRRLGMTVKVETGGKELSLKNQKLIVVRMRYGGQTELGGALALITDAPA